MKKDLINPCRTVRTPRVSCLAALAVGMLMAACATDGDSGVDGGFFYDGHAYDGVPTPGEREAGGDRFEGFDDNPFVMTADEPVSTFSVDADGASYAVMRRYVAAGYSINPQSVRIEEFLNYFTFDYPSPHDGNTVAINAEAGPCPWAPGHRLLRLGVKGRQLADSEVPRANYVFLVDVSGSMSVGDRLSLLKSGLKQLLYKLNPDDRISLVTYSGRVSKLLESTPVSQAPRIEKAIDQLRADGATAGGEAMKMAYEEALANYDPACNNRVIMGTDGDFNVGVTSADALVSMVEGYAAKGIYLTCLGFGLGNLNDAMMEKISNAGNGNYYYIDSENEMMKVFVDERQRFVSVANDAKCQVTFDDQLVSSYRLIGYENRVMSNDDFDDDRKDAGEIGAGQTVTALYEIVPTDRFLDAESRAAAFATFDFRYKKSLGGSSLPLQTRVTVADVAAEPTVNLGFAAGVAAYGMMLRRSPYKGSATFQMAAQLVGQSLAFDPDGRRAELLGLMAKAEEISGREGQAER